MSCPGARVYLAMNTLIQDDEMDDALCLAEEACRAGVDALIVQDRGLARRLRAAAPEMPLHASTQLSCHTPEGSRGCRKPALAGWSWPGDVGGGNRRLRGPRL